MVTIERGKGAGHNRGRRLRGQTTVYKINKLQGWIIHGCNQYFTIVIHGVWSLKSMDHYVAQLCCTQLYNIVNQLHLN